MTHWTSAEMMLLLMTSARWGDVSDPHFTFHQGYSKYLIGSSASFRSKWLLSLSIATLTALARAHAGGGEVTEPSQKASHFVGNSYQDARDTGNLKRLPPLVVVTEAELPSQERASGW